MKVTHDVVVKVGSYTDSDGNAKNRYENVGKVFEKEDGGTFITVKRTFNPAGVPNPDGRDSVILSLFAAKGRDGEQPRQQQSQQPRQQQPRQQQKPQQNGDAFDGMNDDIPF
jgi:single-stranded DNA-binding protein